MPGKRENFVDQEKHQALKFFTFLLLALLLLLVSIRYLGSASSALTGSLGFQAQRVQDEYIKGNDDPKESRSLLIIGDSTASKNFYFRKLKGFKEVSFSVHGGSLVDGYFLLKRYLKNNPAPTCAIVMTSYGAYTYHLREMFWPFLVNKHFYSLNELLDIYQTGISTGGFPANIGPVNFWAKVFLNWDWFNGFEWSALQAKIFHRELALQPTRAYREARNNHGAIHMNWENALMRSQPFSTPAEEHFATTFTPHPALDSYIKRLLALLQQHDVRTHFMLGPIAESLKSPKSEAWLQDYFRHIGPILNRYPGVKNHLKMEWMENGFFYDGVHLLNVAADAYTNKKKNLFENCR